MFSKFTEEARKVLIGAKKEMSELRHPYVGSEHLLLSILKNKNSNIAKKLKKYNLEYDGFKKEIISIIGKGTEEVEWYLYTPLLKKVIEDAMIEARNQNIDVSPELLLSSLIQEGEGIAIRVMLSMNIDLDSILTDFCAKNISKKSKVKKKLMIDEYGYDMTKKALQEELDPVVGRDKEIQRLIEILCRRTKNNPLLIGDAGVGKTAIVEELSRRITTNNVPIQLRNKRIVSISMSSLVAGTKYRGEFEERITKMLKELEQDNNVIIFIDEMHTLVGAGGAEGAIDASNILKPILARGKLKIIGATTTEEYKKFIEEDRALDRRFQTITIDEPTISKTKEILYQLKPIYESFHNVSISNEIIDMIVELSNKYIYNRKQPDKSIDILDEVCSKVSISKDKKDSNLQTLNKELLELIEKKNIAIVNQDFIEASKIRRKEKEIEDKINRIKNKLMGKTNPKLILKEDIYEVVNIKAKIPVYELSNQNEKEVIKLKEKLSKKVIGQGKAVTELYQISKRIKLGFKDSNKPISLLFVGPTGVGKTLLVKEFAKEFIGDNNLITLDMSEYREEHTISKIIGSPPGYVGYSNKNTVIEEIRNKPYSVILVDEIEKAHPSVINLFLQILDEGKLKDSTGNVTRFDHNIIIMTSNIGFNKTTIGFSNNEEDVVNEKLKDYLSPEIINRIDEVVVFNRLTKIDLETILKMKIKEIKSKFKEKGISINVGPKVIEEIIKESKYEQYGARKVDKIIKRKIDDLIIDSLLQGKTSLNIQTIH